MTHNEFFLILGTVFGYVLMIVAFALIVYYAFKFTIDKLSNIFKYFWILFEYVYYKREFLEFMKTEERHPKVKNLKLYSYEDMEWAFETGAEEGVIREMGTRLGGDDYKLKHYLSERFGSNQESTEAGD